jgi:predicted Zn finger-like uncharacterized protein
MIVTCPSCHRRYNLDDQKLKGRSSATVRCPNCKTSIEVAVASPPGDQTARLDADASLLPSHVQVPEGELSLLPNLRVSLAVLQGKDTGRIFKLDNPTITIGRGESDVDLDDPEVSRQHARLEVHGARVFVRDLGSTNGTFVDDVKVAEAELGDKAEFRVGGTRLMLILTEVAEEPA